jgi:hypothetical protein
MMDGSKFFAPATDSLGDLLFQQPRQAARPCILSQSNFTRETMNDTRRAVLLTGFDRGPTC